MFNQILFRSSNSCHICQKSLLLFSSKLCSKIVRQLSSSAAKPNTSVYSSANVCVIGNGSEANPSSISLTCGENTYLFNCGEGLQRLVPQYNLKVSKIQNLFLTSNDWRNVSGISGLMLTQIDSGFKDFNVFGLYLNQLIQFITTFDFKFDNCTINCTDFEREGNKQFIDDCVRITPIVVRLDSDKQRTNVAYVCNLLPQKGILLLDKCFHMKIPRSLLPRLSAGQSIVLESGRRISPSEVHSPDLPEKCLVVLECQTEGILTSLLKNEELVNQLTLNKDIIECAIHMTPTHVINNLNYEHLLRFFRPEANHMIVNEQNPSFSLHAMHRAITQLNYLDPKVFPLISEGIEFDKKVKKLATNVVKCQTGLQYVFRPEENQGFSFDALNMVTHKHIREDAVKDHELNDRTGLEQCVEKLRAEQKVWQQSAETETHPEVLFLGTASAQPMSHRNVTSILVNISTETSILLDCGEDTFGQLLRFYGSDELKTVLLRMKAVFITHMHTDHHMGLIRLITKHFEYTSKPIIVFVPPVVDSWLTEFSQLFEDISHKYKSYLTTEMDGNAEAIHVLSDLKLKQLKAIPVKHCDDSFGVLLHTEDTDKRIVFSGDADPSSDQLLTYGKGCDLLIHEATQDDARVSLARMQCHSTVSEAIEVGRNMSAKFTILTHFSQRYGKLPLIPDQHKCDPNLGIAFDFMRVSLPELSRLPLLSPALHCMYATHIDRLKGKESLQRRRSFIVGAQASV